MSDTMVEKKIVNGVDVGLVEDTVAAINRDPELAKFKFRLHNKWVDCGHNHSTVGNFFGCNQENSHLGTFEMDLDEPQLLAGADQAANPVEYQLSALAGCLTSTLIYHAAIRGIRIEELESELEGDMDLRGFLGLSTEVRRGYQNIRVKFKVRTDEENLARLQALSKLSPVFDVTSNGTNVDIGIEAM